MSTIPTGHSRPTRSQHAAIPRPDSTTDEAIRLSRPPHASPAREADDSPWRASTTHRDRVNNLIVMIVILLSIVIGLLAPYISRTLWIY